VFDCLQARFERVKLVGEVSLVPELLFVVGVKTDRISSEGRYSTGDYRTCHRLVL